MSSVSSSPWVARRSCEAEARGSTRYHSASEARAACACESIGDGAAGGARGVVAVEVAHVAHVVRLIEVVELRGDARPVGLAVDAAEDGLEADDAREAFGAEAHPLREQAPEGARTGAALP